MVETRKMLKLIFIATRVMDKLVTFKKVKIEYNLEKY